VPQIKEAEQKTMKVRISFSQTLRRRTPLQAAGYYVLNNRVRAKSVRNAFLLMDLLLIGHKEKEIQLQEQFTLGEF
jgi:hypothetical protein